MPQYTKHMQIGGMVVASIALIASAFVTKAGHLIITLGVLYPFAGGKIIRLVSSSQNSAVPSLRHAPL